MAVKPVTPDEAIALKATNTPDFVMEAWNNIIAKNLVDGRSHFTERELAGEILRLGEAGLADAQDVYAHGWLDLEPVFRAIGWDVQYSKPAYCERGDATFTFTAKD